MPRASRQALATDRLQRRLRCAVPATEFKFRGHGTPLSAPGSGSKRLSTAYPADRKPAYYTCNGLRARKTHFADSRFVIRRRARAQTGVPDARTGKDPTKKMKEYHPSFARANCMFNRPSNQAVQKKSSALLLTTRSTKVSATRGSREAERSSNTQCGEDNTFSDEPRCASERAPESPPTTTTAAASQRAQMRPPFSRATKSKVSVRAQTSPRRKGKTRDTDAKQKCPSAPMSAFDDSPERLPTLTESINEKANKCSLSEPLLLQLMLLSSLTLFLWGSWSTKFSRKRLKDQK